MPRNIKKWYSEHKRIGRKTAFQICFAFHLNAEETDDFLRRICLLRGFDCHDMEEIVYFFAIKKALDYQHVCNIIEQIHIIKPGKIDTENVIYTDFLAEEIDSLDTEEELVAYLTRNAEKFGYNNAAAYRAIKYVWKEIASGQGLAIREKKKLYMNFDRDREQKEVPLQEKDKKRKERKRMDDSMWEIYLQILGLAGNYASSFYEDRSIKSILKDNPYLHPFGEESFPDRDGLTKILNGEHISHERVRKILILLVFYHFWAGKALSLGHYEAGYGDADRCLASLNDFLMRAGYPFLYAGNPFESL